MNKSYLRKKNILLLKEIPIAETGMFPKIVLDYLSGDDFLKPFYQLAPNHESFQKAILERKFSQESRDLLSGVLRSQYESIGINDKKTISIIDSLKDKKTFTVTTGHQLCIFTGPLYFIYKILTTIKLAEDLKAKYPEYNFVPVFWLASEDHDFEEINHIHLFGKKITWNIDSKKQPVGGIETQTLKPVIEEIKKLFSNSDNELLKIFEESYLKSKNLSEATRKIVHSLFGKYGLVSIEPDDARLKAIFVDVMKKDILNSQTFKELKKTNVLLDNKYSLQVNGRPINFFYLSESGRQLIKNEDAKFVIENSNVNFTNDEIKKEIESHPERFSPNVVLRPLYQEIILPNLAYIGGPAETAYWLQLKKVFEGYQINYPIVWVRNSFFLINQSILKKLEKYKLDLSELFLGKDELIKLFISKESGIELNEIGKRIEEHFQVMIDQTTKFDNQVSSKLIKQKKETSDFIDKMNQELNKKLKEKLTNDLEGLMKIKTQLFPEEIPQERFYNFLQFIKSIAEVNNIKNECGNNSSIRIVQI